MSHETFLLKTSQRNKFSKGINFLTCNDDFLSLFFSSINLDWVESRDSTQQSKANGDPLISELSLHESDICDEGMDIIIQHLSGTLEKLDVGGGRYPVKVQKLIQLPKLKMFWCQDNEFLDPDFESIEELAVLKEQMPHLQINGANLGKY